MRVRLRIRPNPDDELEVDVVGSPIDLGRNESCEVSFAPLEITSISGRHARLDWEFDHATLADLSSRNGTFLNGRAITRPVRINVGDEIWLGRGGPRVDILEIEGDTAASRGTVLPPTAAMPAGNAAAATLRQSSGYAAATGTLPLEPLEAAPPDSVAEAPAAPATPTTRLSSSVGPLTPKQILLQDTLTQAPGLSSAGNRFSPSRIQWIVVAALAVIFIVALVIKLMS